MSLSRFYSPLAAIAAMLCCASCTDDIERTDLSAAGAITFSVSDSQEWLETGSRSELPSVTDPVIIPLGNNDGEPLYVHVALQKTAATFGDEPKSRGELLTGDNFATKVTEIGLIGYKYTGTTFSFDGATPDPDMNNIKLVKSGDHWEAADKLLRWPGGDDKYAFVAYAPYHEGSADDVTNGLTLTFDNGTSQFTYKCGSAVENNPDFVVAYTDGISTKGSAPVELNFIHPLASMKFKASDDFVACKISKLDITGATADVSPFLAQGSYRLSGAADAIGAWDAPAADAARIGMGLTIESGSEIDATAGNDIGSATQVFMAIPEETVETTSESAPKAKVDIALNISGVSVTASPELPLFRIPGYTTIYTISNKNSITITAGTFEVTGDFEFDYTGNTIDAKVESTIKINENEIPVGWTVSYNTPDGSCPDWLTFPEYTEGTTDYNVIVSPQTAEEGEDSHSAALKKAPELSEVCDLSLSADGTMNTANCYLVNARGTYRLPLVYGNAIKNGNINLDSGIGEENFIPAAKSAEGVVDPKIPNADNATVVWQDVTAPMIEIENAITTDENGYQYLTFKVNDNIMQGNAVVAVRDASQNILWSWHIWVTDYKLGENLIEIKQKNEITVQAMPYTLGFCFGPKPSIYPEREVEITLTQDETGATKTFKIVQKYYERYIYNNTPLYQWGRKDPFVAATNDENEKKDAGIYDSNGVKKCYETDAFKTEKTTIDIATSILNPNTFYFGSNNWLKTAYHGLWDKNYVKDSSSGATTKQPKKTIYDPSPVGYCVPFSSSFNWGNETNSPAINALLSDPERGAWIYCDNSGSKPTGELMFLPASGRRLHNNGNINEVGKYCMFWTTGSSSGGGNRFRIDKRKKSSDSNKFEYDVNTAGYQAAAGCAVLAIKEQ